MTTRPPLSSTSVNRPPTGVTGSDKPASSTTESPARSRAVAGDARNSVITGASVLTESETVLLARLPFPARSVNPPAGTAIVAVPLNWEAGTKVAVASVPTSWRLVSVPPVTATLCKPKSAAGSLSWNVITAVPPTINIPDPALLTVTLGATVSIANARLAAVLA